MPPDAALRAESAQPRQGGFVRGLLAGQGAFDLSVDGCFGAAAPAVVDMGGDPAGGELIGLAVQARLQVPDHLPAAHAVVRHPTPAPDHSMLLLGASPAAASWVLMRLRARCRRLITVPSGTCSSAAASA